RAHDHRVGLRTDPAGSTREGAGEQRLRLDGTDHADREVSRRPEKRLKGSASSRTQATTAPELARAAPVFAALGGKTRLDIVARQSSSGPQSIVQLTEGARVSRQAITKHLHALARAGLVRSDRKGRERIWEIRVKRLADARRYLDLISAQWDEAI